MKSYITTAIAIFAAANTVLPSFAADSASTVRLASQTPPAACSKMQCGGEKFKLSDDQLEKLHALKAQFLASNAEKGAEVKVLKSQLFDELSKPTVDKSAVLSIQSKINNLKDELSTSRVSMMADASTIFTPEQRLAMRHRYLARSMRGGHGRAFGGGKGFHGKFEHKATTT